MKKVENYKLKIEKKIENIYKNRKNNYKTW